MKAAVLKALGEPLAIDILPDPVLGTGEVIVDVLAAGIPNYTAGIFSGARNYMLQLPIVPGPGGIGRVRATGPDSTRLKVGQWVFCDPTIRARDNHSDPDSILLGWTAHDRAALPLHRFFHNGSYAERMLIPTENVTPIGEIETAEAGRWCALGQLLVPYGGLLAMGLKPGETLVVNGATGGFGGAAVAVALALGAGKVIATGRNQRSLDTLVERHGARVVPVRMTGVEDDDRRRITGAAAGPVDGVLDFLPREASQAQVRAAALSVSSGGHVVLMGGAGAGAEPDLPLPYRWLMHGNVTVRGQWMYSREAIPRVIRMIRAGLIDLDHYQLTEFGLEDANEAVAYAAANAGPLQLTVLRPDHSGAHYA